MEIWDRLLILIRMMRGYGLRHYELNERLQTALVKRADREQRPAEELQAELVAAGLDHLDTSDRLREMWDNLSPRERDVTAFTCLGYTNQQMAKEMWVSPHTVKEYLRSAQVKWKVHNKSELRLLLAQWDFSAWGEHPGTP
jgi:DNA-binding CsgD family transcriptional regulator